LVQLAYPKQLGPDFSQKKKLQFPEEKKVLEKVGLGVVLGIKPIP